MQTNKTLHISIICKVLKEVLMKNTENILWLSIKDIESTNGTIILNKKNVSKVSAEHNNGKCISRPTIDSYKEISNYILNEKNKSKNDLKIELKEAKELICKLKNENKKLKEINILHDKKIFQF